MQRRRLSMGLQIAPFPAARTLDDFDYKLRPSLDHKLVRELDTGRSSRMRRTSCCSGHRELVRRIWRSGSKAEQDGQLGETLRFYAKLKLLLIDELGYLPFEKRSAHLFFQLEARRFEDGSLLITTNQTVSPWGAVFRDDVLAAAVLDRLLHHRHMLVIQGEGYRLKTKRKAGLVGSTGKSNGSRFRPRRPTSEQVCLAGGQ